MLRFSQHARIPEAPLGEGYLEGLETESMLRFDLGVNARGFSPRVAAFLRGEEAHALWTHYARGPVSELERAVLARHRAANAYVTLAPGLEGLILSLASLFLDPGDCVAMPSPGFFLFEEASRQFGATVLHVARDEQRQFAWREEPLAALHRSLREHGPKILWIANPDNPTGQWLPPAAIAELVREARHTDTLVVVDEAYGDYTDGLSLVSASRLLDSYDNMVVLRSFSKGLGLAGMRLGYALTSNARLHAGLNAVRGHYPLPATAAKAALLALEDTRFLELTRQSAATERVRVQQAISQMQGFHTVVGRTPLVMLRHEALTQDELDQALRGMAIQAARLPDARLAKRGYLRLALRTPEDNYRLLQALGRIDHSVGSQAVSITPLPTPA